MFFLGLAVGGVGFALSLQMGVAFNHVAAVAMPLVGGFIWKYAGPEWVFYLGAAAAAASVAPAMLVPARAKRH